MSRDTIRLPRDAYRLLQTLRAAGHNAYVVGGCVRDSLLGRRPATGTSAPLPGPTSCGRSSMTSGLS